MTAPRVVLVGPMGAGKTTVGRLLAERWDVPFADTDDVVESAEGRSVSDIFVDSGEEHFRALERAAVAQALAGHPGVLALGGGAVMSQETRATLAAERDRAGKAESALRAELEALQGARERAISAEEAAREARAAELAALDSARDRLRPAPAVPLAGHDSLIAELGRAADRLRQEAAGAVEAAAGAPAGGRDGALRRLARRLRGH